MDSSAPLISLTPQEVLTFRLQKDVSPKVVLRITNISNQRVAFKVKTTQPTWYFVRPNQQLLDIGASEDIAIALVEAECNRVVDQANNTGVIEKLDKHRFLVLSRALDDEEYTRIAACTAASAADEKQALFAMLWSQSSSKDDKRNFKLHVEYVYPNAATATGSGGDGSSSSSPANGSNSSSNSSSSSNQKSNNSNNRSTGSSGDHLTVDAAAAAAKGSAGGKKSSSNSKPGAPSSGSGGSMDDLQELKRKYDAIVEYTVHLTAERDMIVTQLDVLKREYNSELAKHKRGSGGRDTPTTSSSSSAGGSGSGGSSGNAGTAGGDDNGKVKVVKQQGFSWVVLVLVALLAFVLGRLLHI